MGKKLYVGNLSWGTNDESLKNAFQAAGTVESAKVVKDKYTDRSRGFAFVEMTNDDDANKAIEMFDGKDLDGRQIKVNEARPPKNDRY